ncbi:hypothetical protein [Stigmatella aurantiaca]|uniref:Conserved uncharacterized protein n=1 Tax=Stigmatella aurantiaca (strain DW4/3-1) TaxID=378806 RepID=Q08WS1_STIAD|nr:hypothetical protein [Stigmatella aurantiaca]ADO71856.1 conserved uncharacterized protein [Stigmatella aurantiaca DW4/3-1]EAU64940.1 hypothetical protein STIAU_1885 [Stigmatella aurantiaca DW4/3-1]
MYRLRAVLAALTLGAPLAASAADITRIASSFEENDPFDLFIDVGFERTQNRSKITREQLTGTDGRIDATELWYKGVDSRLNIDLSIGIYKDLELSFGLPLILQQNDSYGYVSGTTDANSTIVHNRLNPDGSLIPGGGEQALFTVPSTSKRGGLGNMRFGLAYAFFNQADDSTKPTWILGIDYEAPTAKVRDPSQDNTEATDERGNVGDRVHKYTLYTSFSRKLGVAEPYFKAHHTIPVTGPGIYSNCFNSDNNPPTLGRPGNCGQGPWNRKETGIQAPSTTGFVFGTEITAFNSKNKNQQFALDLRTLGNYVSRGRYYNELSSALRKLLATQDYFQVGGMIGATASAGEAFRLRASGTFLYNTDHTLTDEDIGKDLDGNGTIDISDNPAELNPTFDYRTDLTSRRFRATESKTFRLELSATFSF